MKNNNIPKVSVLMCVYNGEKYLHDAITSILNQSYKNFEFVIVDDGSSKNTKDILDSYKDPRIVLITNPNNIGLTKSLNIGLANCRGEYIARMDSDDICFSERLEKQAKYLDDHSEIAVLGSQVIYINSDKKQIDGNYWKHLLGPLEIRWQSVFESPFIHSSVMMRTKIIRDILGGYNDEISSSQDYELWSRAVNGYDCENLSENLLYFRVHPKSVSANYDMGKVSNVRQSLMQVVRGIFNIQQAEARIWVDEWIRANNQKLFNYKIDLTYIYNQLLKFEKEFILLYPSANKKIIRNHLATMLMRIAIAALSSQKIQAIKVYVKIFRVHRPIAFRGLIKFLIKLVVPINLAKTSRFIKERK